MKIPIRRTRAVRWGLPALVALAAVNHALPVFQAKASLNRTLDASSLNVSATNGKGVTGHNTIVIDETALAAGNTAGASLLPFTTLAQWNYTPETPPTCPSAIKGLSGRSMETVGFMYPLETGDKIKSFCLLRSTQTCCYGPRPQYNQYLLVEMKEPVKFERLTPVLVSGKFVVDPNPGEGYIYRMEGTAVQAVDNDAPETDPATIARQLNLPLFPFAPLATMAAQGRQHAVVPPALAALDGKRVVATGYCVGRTRSTPPKLMLEEQWWDGVAQGTPPTLFNAILVQPKDASQIPALWRPHQTFTGTVHVFHDPGEWAHTGVVTLGDSKIYGSPASRPADALQHGALVPYPIEFALLALLLAAAFLEARRADKLVSTGGKS